MELPLRVTVTARQHLTRLYHETVLLQTGHGRPRDISPYGNHKKVPRVREGVVGLMFDAVYYPTTPVATPSLAFCDLHPPEND